jgi:competence protein ComEC
MCAGDVAYFARTSEPPRWAGVVMAAAMVAALVLVWRLALARAGAAAGVAAALGFAAAQLAASTSAPLMALPRKAVVVTGQVRVVEPLPNGVRVTLDAAVLGEGAPQPRRVRVRLRPEDPVEPATGDVLRVKARLMPPEPPSFPGGWDLQRDAYFAGMGAYGYALTRAAILGHAAPGGIGARIQALRETIAGRIEAVLPDPEGAIAATLLTGGAAAIPESDKQAFRDAGLAHLLAIAGLHIGIVMGLVFGLVRTLLALSERAALFWPCKAIAAVAALAAGGGYMLLTGAHIPIIRSFAMAALVTLGMLLGRRVLSRRGLALAMAAILLIAPEQAVGVSFQMSFSAVLALIAGYEAMRPVLARLRGTGGLRGTLLHHLAALALTSALAGTASAPFAAYHFGQVQLYNVLANVAAVPLTALWIMPAGLAALALMPLHAEALALVPMGWGIDAVLWIGRHVSALPQAVLDVPRPPAWGLAVTALGMAWLGLWRTRVRLAGAAAIAAGVLSPALIFPPDALLAPDGRLAALRAGGRMYVEEESGSSAFILDAWRHAWAAGPPRALPEMPLPGLACDAAGCTLRPHPGGPAARLLLAAGGASDCAADVLLSLAPVRLDCPDPATLVVDRFDLWRDGATAIWLGRDGVRVLTDREVHGARPWVWLPGG